jgi:hypothetical protein
MCWESLSLRLGGNELPSQQLLNLGVISNKCFASGTLKYIRILIIMLISYETVNVFILRMSE